jgi:hypothetical protein
MYCPIRGFCLGADAWFPVEEELPDGRPLPPGAGGAGRVAILRKRSLTRRSDTRDWAPRAAVRYVV